MISLFPNNPEKITAAVTKQKQSNYTHHRFFAYRRKERGWINKVRLLSQQNNDTIKKILQQTDKIEKKPSQTTDSIPKKVADFGYKSINRIRLHSETWR
jgi:seryl-tRNA synthetase